MERGRDGGGATLQPHAKAVPLSNGHVLLASHAYKECGHVAQHFGLPNSDSIRHHGFDLGRMMKTSIALHDGKEAAGRVFPNNNVRRTFQCRTFFPKAA
jgi:hypothetical protein